MKSHVDCVKQHCKGKEAGTVSGVSTMIVALAVVGKQAIGTQV